LREGDKGRLDDHERRMKDRSKKLDIGPGGISFKAMIFTKVFLLKLLLGFGFGLIILALL
jgi:hypothetical protein